MRCKLLPRPPHRHLCTNRSLRASSEVCCEHYLKLRSSVHAPMHRTINSSPISMPVFQVAGQLLSKTRNDCSKKKICFLSLRMADLCPDWAPENHRTMFIQICAWFRLDHMNENTCNIFFNPCCSSQAHVHWKNRYFRLIGAIIPTFVDHRGQVLMGSIYTISQHQDWWPSLTDAVLSFIDRLSEINYDELFFFRVYQFQSYNFIKYVTARADELPFLAQTLSSWS